MKCVTAKPFVKWAGGKNQLLGDIRKQYPACVSRYCEPFVGGGAVLFDVLQKFNPAAVMINDINCELINCYRQIQANPDDLLCVLSAMQTEYYDFGDTFRKEMFYKKRERFNELLRNADYATERAALFIFLNKTCFNGLYRVNKKGLFNVPCGAYKNPVICDRDNIKAVSRALRNTEIHCGDYRECSDFIGGDTFVYIDPPYRPLTATASFTAYAQYGFGDTQQRELCEFVKDITLKGAKVVASNSDPKNTDVCDNFFDDLYSACTIRRVSATRMINSKAANRGNVSELLISNC